MKKKNILAMALALALVAVLAVGATLAYFTDNDTERNTFTMGHVDIDLQESKDGSTWVDTGLSYDKVVPGDKLDKMARVMVSGTSEDCYVMVSVAITTEADTTLTDDNINLLYKQVEKAIAAKSGSWKVTENMTGTKITSLQCVYQAADGSGIAKAGEELRLFDTIEIPGEEFKNNTAEQKFYIDLNAFAIQSRNVKLDEVDWTPANFEDYPLPTPTAPAA